MTVSLPVVESPLLTHSRMTSFKTCPKKHFFEYELGIRPEKERVPLRMGSAIHLGLEYRAKGCSPSDAIGVAVEGYNQPPQWCQAEEQLFDWWVEREKVARLLAGYFWYWEQEGMWEEFEIVEAEGSFSLPLTNPETGRSTPSFQLGGKRDKIIRSMSGAVKLMEHKTCSEDLGVDSDYWKRLRIDQQISLYTVAARSQGHDIESILFDVIRKPSIRPSQIPLLDDDGLKVVLDGDGGEVAQRPISEFIFDSLGEDGMRIYQSDAVSAVIRNLHKRPILVAPTGSGKTVMATDIANRLNARTLWVAHRRELRSSSASALKITKMNSPIDVDVSRCSLMDARPAPALLRIST